MCKYPERTFERTQQYRARRWRELKKVISISLQDSPCAACRVLAVFDVEFFDDTDGFEAYVDDLAD